MKFKIGASACTHKWTKFCSVTNEITIMKNINKKLGMVKCLNKNSKLKHKRLWIWIWIQHRFMTLWIIADTFEQFIFMLIPRIKWEFRPKTGKKNLIHFLHAFFCNGRLKHRSIEADRLHVKQTILKLKNDTDTDIRAFKCFMVSWTEYEEIFHRILFLDETETHLSNFYFYEKTGSSICVCFFLLRKLHKNNAKRIASWKHRKFRPVRNGFLTIWRKAMC